MHSKRFMRTISRILLVIVTIGMGSLPGLSCSSALSGVVRNVNPCGTLLNCDPVEWDLLFIDWPDWDEDPSCVIPGFCGEPAVGE